MYHRFEWTRRSARRNELTRHYEPLQPHLLMALASHFECVTFIDVGSNVGAYALFMSTLPSIRSVHAFEPSPDTFAELQANVTANGANIQLHNQAVSDRAASLQFGIVNTLSGANSLVETSMHSRFEKRIEVEAVRLDDVLSDEGRRICMKMDIEGHEAAALAGMSRYLSRNEVVLQIEDYSNDGVLDAALQGQGFRNLFRVGADRYCMNFEPTLSDRQTVAIFEAAAERLVETNLAVLESMYADGITPITVPVGRSIKLQLGGGLATFARGVRNRIRSVSVSPSE